MAVSGDFQAGSHGMLWDLMGCELPPSSSSTGRNMEGKRQAIWGWMFFDWANQPPFTRSSSPYRALTGRLIFTEVGHWGPRVEVPAEPGHAPLIPGEFLYEYDPIFILPWCFPRPALTGVSSIASPDPSGTAPRATRQRRESLPMSMAPAFLPRNC